jgi:hypothetical protein
VPQDYSNPVTAFQVVFDLKVPGGSDLCFSTDVLDYEFGLKDGNNQVLLSHLIVYDDCHQPFILGLQGSTGTDDIGKGQQNLTSKLHLTQEGILSLEANAATDVNVAILDANARVLADLKSIPLVEGRQELSTHQTFIPGVYLVQITRDGKLESVAKVVVK